MNQDKVVSILSVEQDAVKIHDDAQLEAEHMIAEAREMASVLREQVLAEARRQSEEIVAEGRQMAESERTRILAQAAADAHCTDTKANRHIQDAVRFILDKVTGRE